MRDRGLECANVEMRDALPSLAHARLSAGERQAVESHLEECVACTRELALLREVGGVLHAAGPTLDLERLAAAVTAATRAPSRAASRRADVIPLAPHQAAQTRPTGRRWGSGLTGAGGLRAAALALLVAGAGAVAVGRQRVDTPPAGPATLAPAAESVAAIDAPIGGATLEGALGSSFADLSDAELDVVLEALESEAASLPALEPVVQAPEYRGGAL